ncbi:MAG TPA: UMP kinase [Bacilli bacterium]|jgi:uridylate kinase|nr:UMP kinase [Bacilli bacterium]HOC80893.1 UMP kinase [Bacilli bacterium]HOF54049.1 UMP kinase [Bacilli bacterium]HOH68125.1 UMP kinase [Bacilli bacterium]HPK67858.1 UMP kinase [Bacilli bacterium]
MINYKRILLKLSGEALSDNRQKLILDAKHLDIVATAIKSMYEQGVQIAIVVGAGNIWRGKLAEQIGIERSTADYMGMLGTIINALALQSAIEKTGLECRVMSAIEVKAVSEPYIKKRAISHMEKGRVVIFGGGTGNPFFTTDTTATLRAIEVEADAILMAKNGVDGVYDDDPRTNKDANFIPEITFGELLTRNLQVMDQTAVSMIQYEDIIVHVFNMNDTSNFLRVLNGEKIGTIVKKG